MKEISGLCDSPIADSDGPGFPNSEAVPGRDRGCKVNSGYGITFHRTSKGDISTKEEFKRIEEGQGVD